MNEDLYRMITRGCPWGCLKHREDLAVKKEPWQLDEKRRFLRYQVICSCGAQGPHGSTVEEALRRWNEQRNINEPDRCFDYCDDCPSLRTGEASNGKPERCQDFCYICPHQPTCSDRDDTMPWEGK